jgi:transposase-like protein
MSETTTTPWPTLTGSDKQTAWAAEIRQTKVDALVATLTRDLTEMPGADRIINAYVAAALRVTDANTWINLRRDPATTAHILAYHATPADRATIDAMSRRAAALHTAREQVGALRQRGLTVRQIAAQAGVHTSTVYRWSAAHTAPSTTNTARLDQLLDSTRPTPAWKKRVS